jgi:nitrile hydratase subunit beta
MATDEAVTVRMPKFKIGEKVRVLELNKLGHVRTPFYIRDKQGEVVQYCGTFLNPEDLAVGKTAGPAVECYRVRFAQREIWPHYSGGGEDTLVIEIYEHWMTPAL